MDCIVVNGVLRIKHLFDMIFLLFFNNDLTYHPTSINAPSNVAEANLPRLNAVEGPALKFV